MVHTTQPDKNSIENDIIDRMNVLASKGRMPTPFESAALRRDIERVKTADIPARRNLQGMLSALELDIERAKKHHRAAIRASGNAPRYRNYFAVTLTKLFIFDEAIAILERLAEEDPADLEVLETLIRTLIAGGRFRLAKKWTDVWSLRCPDNPHREAEYLANQVIPSLDSAGLKDSDVGPLFDRAMKITIDHRKHVADSFVSWPDDEDDDAGICLILGLREPSEVIADLITEYCEKEAELGPPGAMANKVSVSFNPTAA